MYKNQMNTVGIILAAGKGTRHRPFTDRCPKPILQARGTTCIDSVLDAMKDADIKDVYIVLNYLADKIQMHLKPRSDEFNFIYCYQNKLNGNLGAVEAAVEQIFGHSAPAYDCCIISAADYFLPTSLISELLSEYKKSTLSAVVAARKISLSKVSQSSEIIYDKNGKLERFLEKPKIASSENPISAALLYAVGIDFLPMFKTHTNVDIEQNCLDVMNKILSSEYLISTMLSEEIIDLSVEDLNLPHNLLQ